VDDLAWYAKRLAQLRDKMLVALALLATQMEVAVDGMAAIVQTEQEAEQGHRVGTTAQGDQEGAVIGEQAVAMDEGLYALLDVHGSTI
jgi:hypothetical protein